MNILIEQPSGKYLVVEAQQIVCADANNLSEHSWQYCKDHAPMQRVDGQKIELALYIGNESEHIDKLGREIIEYGCEQDIFELIEFAWKHHATWLMLHK